MVTHAKHVQLNLVGIKQAVDALKEAGRHLSTIMSSSELKPSDCHSSKICQFIEPIKRLRIYAHEPNQHRQRCTCVAHSPKVQNSVDQYGSPIKMHQRSLQELRCEQPQVPAPDPTQRYSSSSTVSILLNCKTFCCVLCLLSSSSVRQNI